MSFEVKKYFVSAVPNSRHDSVEVISENILRVKIHAKPVDGQANIKLIEVLADYFHVPKSCVEIQAGEYFRKKLVHISFRK